MLLPIVYCSERTYWMIRFVEMVFGLIMVSRSSWLMTSSKLIRLILVTVFWAYLRAKSDRRIFSSSMFVSAAKPEVFMRPSSTSRSLSVPSPNMMSASGIPELRNSHLSRLPSMILTWMPESIRM